MGIGTDDEFMLGGYYLQNHNGINYGLPWIRQSSSQTSANPSTIMGFLDPKVYYNAASDYNDSTAAYATLTQTHRFGGGGMLKTTLRSGRFTRDLRAGTIRFCTFNATTAPTCPTAPPGLDNVSSATLLTRGTNNKVQDLDTTYLQSDYSGSFEKFGFKHVVLAGIDAAHEEFTGYRAVETIDGSTLNKNLNRTTLGTPNDGGGFVDEGLRAKRQQSAFDAKSIGLYVQDLVQVAEFWKVLAGLRYDKVRGSYQTFQAQPSLHGGVGFHARRWQIDQVSDVRPNALTLSRTSPDGEDGFPGHLQVQVIYTLTDEGALRIDYVATTDRPTVCNLTQHSYFNLAGGGDILGHRLRLASSRYLPIDETVIPTGELAPVTGTPFDFTAPTAIGAQIDADHEQIPTGRRLRPLLRRRRLGRRSARRRRARGAALGPPHDDADDRAGPPVLFGQLHQRRRRSRQAHRPLPGGPALPRRPQPPRIPLDAPGPGRDLPPDHRVRLRRGLGPPPAPSHRGADPRRDRGGSAPHQSTRPRPRPRPRRRPRSVLAPIVLVPPSPSSPPPLAAIDLGTCWVF